MIEGTKFEFPRDWRAFNRGKLAKFDEPRLLQLKAFVENQLGKETRDRIRAMAVANPEWWVLYHFGWMMSFRNLLRDGGFGERELGVENLDDYAVPILEYALGVIEP